MRILFLSPRQCRPPITGAKLREYYLARALGRRASLSHVYFADPAAPEPAGQSFWEDAAAVVRPRFYTADKVARGLFGPWPLPVVNYTSPQMAHALAALLARKNFDLVHIDSVHMAAYTAVIRKATAAPIVYDWHNIESELMRRYAANAGSPLRAAYARFTARRLEQLERRILRESFGHVVCSQREKAALEALAPAARIAVVENGVDCSRFRPIDGPPGRRTRLLFVGSMNYHANIDAVLFFARSVWPDVRRAFPGWRLTIAGASPAPAVLALAQLPGIEVTGTVEDVRPYYTEAVAAIVPLLTGGGTRLKILEAFAAGVPVVSTTLGAEGLAVTPGRDILIADGAGEWLPHLRGLAPMDAVWMRLAEAGRRLAEAHYDWESLGATLYGVYCQWLAEA